MDVYLFSHEGGLVLEIMFNSSDARGLSLQSLVMVSIQEFIGRFPLFYCKKALIFKLDFQFFLYLNWQERVFYSTLFTGSVQITNVFIDLYDLTHGFEKLGIFLNIHSFFQCNFSSLPYMYLFYMYTYLLLKQNSKNNQNLKLISHELTKNQNNPN